MGKLSRWLFVIFIVASAAALVWWAYQRFASQVTLRVAVPASHSDELELMTNLSGWLKQNGRRTRIDIVQVTSETEAAQAVAQSRAELLTARADETLPPKLASVISLYKDVAIFVVPPGSPVKGWSDLKGRTIGLVSSTADNDPLLSKILKLVHAEPVKFVTVVHNTMPDSIGRKDAQLYATIRPIIAETADDSRRLRSLKAIKGKPTVLEVPDAETAADSDNRYEAYDIPAAALRRAPPLPEEVTTTLAVARHLLISKSVPALLVQRVVIDLMDAKRALSSSYPLARQIGSPGSENDSAVPIHSGALHYFNGDELSLVEILMEWIYAVPMILGALGALLTWLYKRIWPGEMQRAERTMEDLLLMRRETGTITTRAELADLIRRRSDLQDQIELELSEGGLEDRTITALLVAAEAVDRRIDAVELRLQAPPSPVPERQPASPEDAAPLPWRMAKPAQLPS